MQRSPVIILIGMMGSGKSTVGRLLADGQGYDFLDTDAMVEEIEGVSISDIFRWHGEATFRDMETAVLAKILADKRKNGCIISTGGGIVLNPKNGQRMRAGGVVIYLQTTVERLVERLIAAPDSRPLLPSRDRVNLYQIIDNMLQDRDAMYREAANFTICQDNDSAPEVAEKIALNLGSSD